MLLLTFFPFVQTQGQVQGEGIQYVITVKDNYFEEKEIKISVSDTVIFRWAEGVQYPHNIVQINNFIYLEILENGFASGDSTLGPFEWELPAEYIVDNTTLYYACEPHLHIAMKGKIIIGEGSPEPKPASTEFAFMTMGFILLAIYKSERKSKTN